MTVPEPPAPITPGSVLGAGLAMSVVGVLITLSASDSDLGTTLGVALTGLGGVALLVGIVALGVTIALRHDRHIRD